MGLRRQVLFIGDDFTQGTGVNGATVQGGWRGLLLNLRFTNGMTWRVGGSNTTGMISGENRFTGGSGLLLSQIAPSVTRDGAQWQYNLVVAQAGYTDYLNRFNTGTPTLATTQASITTILDTIRAQVPTAPVFWVNQIPNTTVAFNTQIVNDNAAIQTQLAGRADAAYLYYVDAYTAYNANPAYSTQWGQAGSMSPFGFTVIANTISAAITAAGY